MKQGGIRQWQASRDGQNAKFVFGESSDTIGCLFLCGKID